MAGELTSIKQNIIDLYQQINCIKNGDCCGVTFETPAFSLDNTTKILTSTFVDGTAIPVDFTSLFDSLSTDNIYTADGVIGSGREATLTDTFSILSSTGKPLHTFHDSGDTYLVKDSEVGSLSVGIPSGSIPARFSVKGTTNNIIASFEEEVKKDMDGIYVRTGSLTSVNSGSIFYNSFLLKALSTHNNDSASDLTTNKTGVFTAVSGASSTLTAGHFIVNHAGSTDGILNSGYQAAVRGEHANQQCGEGDVQDFDNNFGGYFTTHCNNGGKNTTKTRLFAAVRGHGIVHRQQPGHNIGGMFSVTNVSSSFLEDSDCNQIALLIPSTDNNGNVVIGADDKSANNSMLEVTGDIESIGTSSNIVLARADGTRVKLSVDNLNTLTAVLA